MLGAQEQGCRLAKQWGKGDLCAATHLPLCTLAFEIVGSRNVWDEVDLKLHPPQVTGPQLQRTLFDYVELCTPDSRSCVLFLMINHTFRTRYTIHKAALLNISQIPMRTLSHGVRILPPSASRHPYIHLPTELLHLIFKEVVGDAHSGSWRGALISIALVCRCWRSALDHLYTNFTPYNAGRNPPDILRLARTIELKPKLGTKIRCFDTTHFRRVNGRHEAAYLDSARAIITILQNATLITDLRIFDTHRTLARDFVRALCSSSQTKSFLINRRDLVLAGTEEYVYTLNVGDILQCMSHWPHFHTLHLYAFSPTTESNDLPALACSIESVVLQHGSLNLPQLRLLTTSWRSTLKVATLQYVSGLSNADLRTWLVEVGPTLTTLGIQYSHLSRRSNDEYAVDAMLPRMINLHHLTLEGDIASELVLSRYIPHESVQRSKSIRALTIYNAPGVNAHGLVSALRTTNWSQISGILPEENTEWKGELQTIARDRNIFLM